MVGIIHLLFRELYKYRDGRLVATKLGIPSGQKAVFRLKPAIYLGVVSQIQQGQVMESAVVSRVNTELLLHGIASADIIMTGGGAGPDATAFKFALDNVVRM